MQKKIIAAAVAGLLAVPALAQTNVTVSGRFAAGWESYKISNCGGSLFPTTQSCDAESAVSDQSSRIIFNVSEDLGGGLSAWAQLDSRFSTETGGATGWGTGNTGFGFMHKQWGKFTLGRWDVHYQEIEAAIGGNRAGSLQTLLGNGLMSQVGFPTFASVGDALGSVAAPRAAGYNTAIANGTRTPNMLMWDSPNWNGFTARLAYSTGWQGSEGFGRSLSASSGDLGGGDAWTAALRYNNGPWTAGYSYWHADTEPRQDGALYVNQRSQRLWAGYAFAFGLRVGVAWDQSAQEWGTHGVPAAASGDYKRSAWMIPVSYAFGPHRVYAAYARAGEIKDTPGYDSGASAWSAGYDYAFSKRTSIGIFYTQLNNQEGASYNLYSLGQSGATVAGAANGTVGADPRQWYIGMAHNF
jgi:predicted porin